MLPEAGQHKLGILQREKDTPGDQEPGKATLDPIRVVPEWSNGGRDSFARKDSECCCGGGV